MIDFFMPCLCTEFYAWGIYGLFAGFEANCQADY